MKRSETKEYKEYMHNYYLKHKEKIKNRVKEWRKDNPDKPCEYGKRWKQKNHAYNMKINKKTYQAFCIENEWKLIENYELAKADNFEGWDCHHRLELHPDCSLRFTRKSLQDLDLYYNRPANELIFLTHSEHARIHNMSKKEYNE